MGHGWIAFALSCCCVFLLLVISVMIDGTKP